MGKAYFKGKQRIIFQGNCIKAYLGLVLAAVSFLLCIEIGGSAKAAAVLCVGVLFFSFVHIVCSEKTAKCLNLAWCMAMPFAVIVMTQLLLNQHTITLGIFKIFMGALCVGVLMNVVFIFTVNIRATVVSTILVCMLLTTVNYFVFNFRGNEFAPYDFLAIGTAMDVAGQYEYSVEPPVVYAWILALLYILCGFCIPKMVLSRSKKSRGISVMAEIAAACVLIVGLGNVDKQEFANIGSIRNGYLLNFVCRISFTSVEKPQNYSMEAITDCEEKYEKDANSATQKPNVIVIMNESFSDLRILGDLQTDVEILPFYDSLQDETIHGYALASSIGGGTCNSEFQVLTGNNMGFLPNGTFPYQQYLKGPTYSMFTDMEECGYHTLATHPARGGNWMRTTVYPHYGVDELYFEEDYPQKDLFRMFITDREMYDQVISWYEERVENEPLFLFGVTVQNHGGYDYEGEDWKNGVCLRGTTQQYPKAEQYLTLLRYSDQALESFINYFESRKEPVVILFFGDHLPNVDGGFYEELYGGSFDTLEEKMLQYTVPFFVWANYEIEACDIGLTSLNFLSNYVYEAAGLPLPAYNEFMKEVQSVIPAMNAYGYYSKAQGTFVPYEQATGEEADILEKYQILQYNCMFDEENRSEIFFPTPDIEVP